MSAAVESPSIRPVVVTGVLSTLAVVALTVGTVFLPTGPAASEDPARVVVRDEPGVTVLP